MGNAPPGRTQATVAPDANPDTVKAVNENSARHPSPESQGDKGSTKTVKNKVDESKKASDGTQDVEKKEKQKPPIEPLPKSNNLLAPALDGPLQAPGSLSPVKKRGLAPVNSPLDAVSTGNRRNSGEESIRNSTSTRGSGLYIPNLPAHEAAYQGNLEALQNLIEAGECDTRGTDDHGHTLLYYAIVRNRINICDWLLSQDHSLSNDPVDSTSSGAMPPLLLACSYSFSSIIESILNAGADIHVRDIKGRNASQIVHTKDALEVLLKYGVALDTSNLTGENCMTAACAQGYWECVEYICNYCDQGTLRKLILHQDAFGNNALHTAAKHGQFKCLESLHPHCWEDLLVERNSSGQLASELAKSNGHESCFDILCHLENSKGSTNNSMEQDWKEYLDQNTGAPYWYNENTSETTWSRPMTVDVVGHSAATSDHVDQRRTQSVAGPISAVLHPGNGLITQGSRRSDYPQLLDDPPSGGGHADILVINHDDGYPDDAVHLVYDPSDPHSTVADDPLWAPTDAAHSMRPMTAAPGMSHTSNWYENEQPSTMHLSSYWGNHNAGWDASTRPATAALPSFYEHGGTHAEDFHRPALYTQQTYYMRPNTAQSYQSVFSGLDANFDLGQAQAGEMALEEDADYLGPDDPRPGTPWTERRNQGTVEDWYGEWAQYVDPETQRPFWWNSITGENRWDPPPQMHQGPQQPMAAHQADLPFANSEAHHIRQRSFVVGKFGEWTECKDPVSGDVFFYNNGTGECEWELPPEVEEQRLQTLAREEAEIHRQAMQEAEGWVWTMRRKQDIATEAQSDSDWSMMQDSETGAVFYMNRETGETRWNEPEEFRGSGEATLKPVPSEKFSEEEKAKIMERARKEAMEEMIAEAKKKAIDTSELAKITEKMQSDAAKEMAEQMKKAMHESKAAQEQLAEQLRQQTEMQLKLLQEQTKAMNDRIRAQAEQEEEMKHKMEEEIKRKRLEAKALEEKLKSAEYEVQMHAKRKEHLNKLELQRSETKQNVNAIREEKAEILAEHEQELKELAAVLAADRTRQAAKLKEKLEERRRKRALQRAAAMSKAKPKEGFSNTSSRSIKDSSEKAPMKPTIKIFPPKTSTTVLQLTPDAKPLFDKVISESIFKLVEKLLLKSQSLNAVVEFNRQFLSPDMESQEESTRKILSTSPGVWMIWALFRYFCTESVGSSKSVTPMTPTSSGSRLLGRLLMAPGAFRGMMRAIGFAQAPPRNMVGLTTGELDTLYQGFRSQTLPGLPFYSFLQVLCQVAFQVLQGQEVESLDEESGGKDDKDQSSKYEAMAAKVFEGHLFEPGRAIARFMFKRSERYQKESKALANNHVRNVLQSNVNQLKAIYMHFIKVLYKRMRGKKSQTITMFETFQFASQFSVVPDMCTCRDLFRIFEDMHILKTLPIGSLANYDIPFNKWVQLLFHAAVRFYKIEVDAENPTPETPSAKDSKEGGDTKPTKLSKIPEAHVAIIAFLSWLERSEKCNGDIRGLSSFALTSGANDSKESGNAKQ